MRVFPTTQKIVLALFLLIVFAYSFNQLKESDSFYHLQVGRVIWETRSIPRVDIFSYTAAGAPWVTHEWLAELVFFGVKQLTGLWGLMAFVAALAVLTFFLVFRLAIHRGANPLVAAFFLFLFGYLILELWIPRPQTFAALWFVVLVYCLERYRATGGSRYLFFSVGDIWLWANMNASVLLGLVVLALYTAVSVMERFSPRLRGNISESSGYPNVIWPYALTFAVSGISALVNPNGYAIFTYNTAIRPAVEMLNILEWKSILASWSRVQTKLFLTEMLAGDMLLGWWLGYRRATRNLAWLGVALGVSVLPFLAIRHALFWPLAAIAPLSAAVSAYLRRVLDRISPRILTVIVACAGVIFLVGRAVNLPRQAINEHIVPVRAADFIEKTGLRGPMFNLYNEGGFLIWRFFPHHRVFIDGRSEVYPPEIIRAHLDIIAARENWHKLVDDTYRVNFFIIAYGPRQLADAVKPLVAELMRRNWPLVWWDDAALVFVRPAPENAELIKKYAVWRVNPFRAPENILPAERKDALRELAVLLERSPATDVLQNYTRDMLKL